VNFSNGTLLIAFVVCLFGALFTWFAADQYRSQLLSDSHRLVREMALRYLQTLIITTAVFSIGIIATFLMLITNLVRGTDASEADLTPTPEVTITPTFSPLDGLPTLTPTPTDRPPLPTATLIAPNSDPTLAAAQTAIVGGTNGLGVNLRDAPGVETNVIGIVPEGSPVTLVGETDFVDGLNWVAVISPNGERGWITDLFLIFQP
jgi:hypothetical protein